MGKGLYLPPKDILVLLTILGKWIREPFPQNKVTKAELALCLIGVLDELHLVHSLQPDMGQLPLQLSVEDHLHGQPLELGIAANRFDIADGQTDEQVHQENGHEYHEDTLKRIRLDRILEVVSWPGNSLKIKKEVMGTFN